MPKVLKWLIFIALCVIYIWAVFLWDRSSEASSSIAPDTAGAGFEVEFDSIDDSQNELYTTEITDSFEQPNNDFITAEDYATEEPAAEYEESAQEPSSFSYYIVSGSYLEDSRARTAKKNLENKGVQAEVLLIDSYYKVIVGKFMHLSKAKSALSELNDKGIPAFIQRN